MGLEVSTDRSAYVPGQAVAVSIRLTSAGPDPVVLSFRSSCRVAFAVQGLDGSVLYDSVRHVGCLMVLTELTLGPGEAYEEVLRWDQRDDLGVQVPGPAYYQIVGYSLSDQPVPRASTIILIQAASIDVRIEALWALLYPGQTMDVTVRATIGGSPAVGAAVAARGSGGCALTPPSGTTNASGVFLTTVQCTTGGVYATVTADVSLSGYAPASATYGILVVASPLPLSMSVTSRTTRMMSLETATIRVRLSTTGGAGVPGGLLTTRSMPAGTFSGVTDFGDGNYTFRWTAPTVYSTTVAAIRVSAKVGGYSSPPTPSTYTITVDPNSSFDLRTLFSLGLSERTALRSGETILVRVYLYTIQGYPVAGANLTVGVYADGTATRVVDELNGLYTFRYTAPIVTGDTAILLRATATKTGYRTVVRSIGLTVSP